MSLLALPGPLPLHPPEPGPFCSATLVLPFSSTYISLAGMSGWWSPRPMPAPSCQGGWECEFSGVSVGEWWLLG